MNSSTDCLERELLLKALLANAGELGNCYGAAHSVQAFITGQRAVRQITKTGGVMP